MRVILSTQIFLSHTKLDKDFCDSCDVAAARVGLKLFRSELESIESPAWATIRGEITKSSALFLLVGKELVRAQASADVAKREEWKYTQNWISCEVGMACQREIDVWVVCDNVRINFPVPYLNNYCIRGFKPEQRDMLDWWKDIFERYKRGEALRVEDNAKFNFKCLSCGSLYNLWSHLEAGYELTCPTCLSKTIFPKGHLPQRNLTGNSGD
jgi:DNA-directed RNA polymerase subunit RPC12/RpoP